MLELKNVHKIYLMGQTQVDALRGVSLSIEDGDFVAIMGPSGSGKSTLMHILGLLDTPSSGSYELAGREISRLSPNELALLRRKEFGFVFQQFHLLPRMSALENVSLPLLYSKAVFDPKLGEPLLKRVGLETRMNHRPNELSGGQQQRVAIARSLVNHPQIILADEPTGNLDSKSAREILELLKDLNRQGITVIIVTHEEEIGAQASRIIRMRDGVIQSDERIHPVPQKQATPPLKESTTERKPWQEVSEYFRQGLQTLLANKVRTSLSMLGILIGVAAVIAMLALGRGAQKSIEAQLASLGSNLLVLRSGAVRMGGVFQQAGGTTKLTIEDASALKTEIPFIKETAPQVSGRGQVVYLNKNWNTQVLGVTSAYPRMRASEPEYGRFFTDEEDRMRARLAVVGTTVVRELFGDQNPIGESIKINKVNFQIIGVLPVKGASGWRDQDDLIYIPLLTAMHRLFGKEYVDSIDIEVSDSAAIDSTQSNILDLMYSRKRVAFSQRDEAFTIRNMADIQSAVSESSKTMSLLLAAVAAISLLVGGIGIMNIMLVSVTERTREIGLRKAIGAQKSNILLQFLSESIVISAIGGLSGVLFGAMIVGLLTWTFGWSTSISLGSVLLAVLSSTLIGVIFGIYPAKRASELNPIDALRHE